MDDDGYNATASVEAERRHREQQGRLAHGMGFTSGQASTGLTREAGEIEKLTKMAQELRARLMQSAGTVSGIADRVFGPEPEQEAEGSAASPPHAHGSIEDLRRQLSGLFTVTGRLDDEIKRFTSL